MQISGWENASPRTKRVVMGGIALAVFVVFAGIIAMMDRSGKKPRAGVKTESESTMMMPSRKNTDMEGMAANATAMQRRIQTLEAENKAGASGLQEQIKQLRDLVSTTSAQKDLPELRIQVGQLSKKLDDMIAAKAEAATRAPNPSKVMPPLDKVVPKKPADGALNGVIPVAVPTLTPATEEPKEENQIRIIGAGDNTFQGKEIPKGGTSAGPSAVNKGGNVTVAPLSKVEQEKVESTYFPMGTIIQGVLLNGLDAPTSGSATKNPTPVLVRIKHEAVLPNRARMDLSECFVIMSGYGSMSQERAILRAEGISCVRDDGGVVETNLSGYAVGEDGRVGIRGRVVTKQGAMLAKSLASGFLSGLGKALTPTGVTGLNLNPSGVQQTQSLDLGTAFESGILGGASSSLNQISKFYLDIAKEMVPVVEIDAGRPVTIIVSKGGSLKFNKK